MENNEEKVSLSDSTVIKKPESQSNTELNQANSLTKSIIICNAVAKSTPVTTKTKENEWSLDDIKLMRTMSDNMNCRFDVNDSKFVDQNIKFNVLSSNINAQTVKVRVILMI